jgi:hypothetical protein
MSSGGGQVKNSFAPARMAWRIRSGSAASAMAKMPALAAEARSRSMPAMADEASPRMSTMMTSGEVPSRVRRSSSRLTDSAPERSIRSICFLKASSWETICAMSCAMDY